MFKYTNVIFIITTALILYYVLYKPRTKPIFLGNSDCVYCQRMKIMLSSHNASNNFTYIESSSLRGLALLREHKPKGLPFFINNKRTAIGYMEYNELKRNLRI